MENSPNKADANGKETPRQNDLPPNRNASNFEQREKVLKELLKQTHTTLDQCYQESKKLNNKFDLYNDQQRFVELDLKGRIDDDGETDKTNN